MDYAVPSNMYTWFNISTENPVFALTFFSQQIYYNKTTEVTKIY